MEMLKFNAEVNTDYIGSFCSTIKLGIYSSKKC